MSIAPPMTLDEFDAWVVDRAQRWELIDGVPRMVPHESIGNVYAWSESPAGL